MNRVMGIVRTHLTDRFSWLLMPWLVLGISFACNLIIGSLLNQELYTGGLASIYGYMLVLGIISVGQTFPFIVGFSARRKDYFLGTIMTVTMISAMSGIVLCLLSYIERQTDYWGVKLHFFNVKYFAEGPALEQFWVYFTIMINLFFMGCTIACIYRKFGRNGLYFFFLGLGIILTCVSYWINMNDGWQTIFAWLADLAVIDLANGLFVGTLLYLLISYLLLRKAKV